MSIIHFGIVTRWWRDGSKSLSKDDSTVTCGQSELPPSAADMRLLSTCQQLPPAGKELRELFVAEPGDVVVGADSSGNQLRGLCHYVRNSDFTREVIFGDQHQRNADILGCDRPTAKSYLYAYLFGAGDAKLGGG